jgi:ureidoglycolate dehydrogenase (NAD+)
MATANGATLSIDAEALASFVTAIFQKTGLSADGARAVADVLVWADLRGVESHGTARIPSYLAFIARGALDPHAKPDFHALTPSAFTIEAHKAAGPIAMTEATDRAIAMARTQGICIATVSNSTHMGAIGYYVQRAARQGCAAIMMAAGVPNIAYEGTRSASVGSSPIAIGIPTAAGDPLVLDMATAVVAMGKLRQYERQGKPLPEGWALDADGNPTTDAAQAVTGLALGGPKGSGLSLMFECLTGILAGSPALAPRLAAKLPHVQNATIIIINIATFRALPGFEADVTDLADRLRSLPRTAGTDGILMPGERGGLLAAQRASAGVPMPPKLWTELSKIAVEQHIPLPDISG